MDTRLPAGREYLAMKKHIVYILKSRKDGRLYKGITADLERRLEEHNRGKTKSTKGFRPWELIHKEEFVTFEEAREREKYYKTGIGRELIRKLHP